VGCHPGLPAVHRSPASSKGGHNGAQNGYCPIVRVWLERAGLSSPEPQNESARLLVQLDPTSGIRMVEVESYRGTAIECPARSVAMKLSAIRNVRFWVSERPDRVMTGSSARPISRAA
jgi:hypothetical protein